jgi:ubiquinone/menaquinone biosynthesis C-methylase UbiE
MNNSYKTVTELPGEFIPKEQYARLAERYQWAAKYATGKDCLECACGAGQGASLLNFVSKSYTAGDYDEELVMLSQKHNPDIFFQQFDALKMPFKNESFDVVLVCEAIYYFPEIELFLKEVKRVLRNNGKILIVSANPSLFDFNPGKLTYKYPSVVDMGEYFKVCGFHYLSAEGGTNVSAVNFRQKILRPIKFVASKLKLIPKTMSGKSWLKKMFFGGDFLAMPSRVDFSNNSVSLNPINLCVNDTNHKVLYFVGEKK